MTIADFYLTDIWNRTLDLIINNNEVDEFVINTFYRDSKLFSLNEAKAIILAPDFLHYTTMNTNILLINKCLSSIINHEIESEIILEKDYVAKINPTLEIKNTVQNHFLKNKLNPNYTFGNFIVGRSNAHSQVASLACANNPGSLYNPLFIYGNSGLGKTHLLNAIGNFVQTNYPNKKIGLISGLDFVDCVFKSIKNGQIDDFKREMYDLDLLLVDDIQFIAGKEKTHEIFFSVFNELVNNRKQICLTSDRIPSEIKGLEDRIISRFNSGLNVNIESPEYETSVNILKSKLANQTELRKNVDDDVLSFIATNFSQDVRALEGALNRLLFYSINFNSGDNITLKLAMDAFKGQVQENKNELTVNNIKKVVCDYYGLTKQQLNSKTRTKNIATARHIAMYLSRKYLDLPYLKIGDEFGKRDHSTVMNACEKVEKQIKQNSLYQKAIIEIENLIKN